MNAAVLRAPRSLSIESRPRIAPGPGEVVVAVDGAGLCGTDFRIWNGDRAVDYPRVMGHELVGRVRAIGPNVRGQAIGQRVAVEPNYSCGHCPLCREGNKNLCLSRTAIGIDVDGGFADEVAVPARCCWPAPADIAHEQLLLVEPLAVVVRAVRRGAPKTGETAAVLGVGALGLLAIQVLKARGCRVLAVGRSARRLPLARELGADLVATTDAGDHVAAAQTISGREGVDLVVETAGTAPAVAQAVELCRPGGRVVLTGLPHEATALEFFWVVRREINILGSMIYQDEFPEALALLASGQVNGRRLLTHRFPLDRIDEAFEAHRAPESIKVALSLAR
jgi:2-desacetyl-2-hydroxyethyl bacteriochlorophyllide A dehydrogenase